jgi:hypothetical protein
MYESGKKAKILTVANTPTATGYPSAAIHQR